MHLALVPLAILVADCRTESTLVDETVAASAPTDVAQRMPTSTSDIEVVQRQDFLHGDIWYDDVFGHYVERGVKLEVVSCTSDELVLEVSAKKPNSRPPASGVAVRLTLLRVAGEVRASARSRWWSDTFSIRVDESDGRSIEPPEPGDDAAEIVLVVLAPELRALACRFTVRTNWKGFPAVVSGGFWFPYERVAPFLDAWNAARAAQER